MLCVNCIYIYANKFDVKIIILTSHLHVYCIWYQEDKHQIWFYSVMKESVGCIINFTILAGVTMTLFRSHGRDACPISLWGLVSRTSAGNLVSHVTFGFAGPETWPVVSCGLVAILAWQGVLRARLRDQSSSKAGVRQLLMEPVSRPRHSWAAVTDHYVYVF